MRGPLQDLLKKRMNQIWEDCNIGLVQQLKKLCTNLPRLAISEPGDKLMIQTDALDKY